jgi:hypothetical protein
MYFELVFENTVRSMSRFFFFFFVCGDPIVSAACGVRAYFWICFYIFYMSRPTAATFALIIVAL